MIVFNMQNHMILLTAALVIQVLCTVRVGGQLCQVPNAVYFNSKCLQLFEERKSWTDAGNDCKSRNGTLVVIDNKKSDDFVREHFLKGEGLKFDVWIGASSTKKWRWYDDGQPLPWAAWGPGEPNFSGGAEDRVMLWRDFDYKWNDERGTTRFMFNLKDSHFEKSNALCEFTNVQSCSGVTNCGSGVFHNESRFCLEVHQGSEDEDGYTWIEANNLCVNRGARLAHIENQSTQNTIVSHIKAESVRNKSRYAGNYWLGAVWNTAEPYTWVWENGKQLDYFNWDSHGTQQANAREAIKLGWTRDFRWVTGVATDINYYMCQSGPRCPEIHPEHSKLVKSDIISSSYVCEDGYHMNGDSSFSIVCLPSGKWNMTAGCSNVNECTMGSHNCSQHANCTDLPGSFTCSCNSGYTGDGYNCNDIDECQTINNCSSSASCTNTNGSYTCSCNSGYTGDGYNCNDIDECQTTNNCSSSASCTNTKGGYTCSCNSGYTGDGYNCNDIDKCQTTNNCSSSASCTNTYGGYTCSCSSGYSGDGYNCNDIDECKTTNNCSSSASCSNTNGGYTCSCNAGFTGDGYNCSDIDECQTTNNCSSLAICTNTKGGYTCSCNSGFTGDGYNCNDIDECKTTNNCSSSASCSNTNGGYTCSCNSGYTGDGYNCNDIDECKTTSNCSSSASCTNTNGGYTCSCNSGYTGDGYKCNDIDECKTTNNCSSSASCTNTNGGFKCTCNTGYNGEGHVCLIVKCQLPELPDKVAVKYDTLVFGSTLTYSCSDGDLVLAGSSTAVCMNNGSWSSEPPSCTGFTSQEGKNDRTERRDFKNILWIIIAGIVALALGIVCCVMLAIVRGGKGKTGYNKHRRMRESISSTVLNPMYIKVLADTATREQGGITSVTGNRHFGNHLDESVLPRLDLISEETSVDVTRCHSIEEGTVEIYDTVDFSQNRR